MSMRQETRETSRGEISNNFGRICVILLAFGRISNFLKFVQLRIADI